MTVIAVTDHVFPDLETERSLAGAAGHELRYVGNAKTPAEVIAATVGANAVLNCYAPMPAEVIERLDDCVIIARYGIGVDTIDLPVATARGILVTNVPDYCIDEVSDHALALILALARGVAPLDRAVREGRWELSASKPLHRIRGRTLGLVGFGRIARRLGEKAMALGFDVIASDPFVSDEAMVEAGVGPSELETLLERSDVVSVHAPLTDATFHMIGAEQFARMKDGAILVNTSRGPLIDTEALRDALATDRLGGVGLDVLEHEPPDPDDPLRRRPDVVITPHAAFSSVESVAELQRKAAEQVLIALAGDTPPYALNAEEVRVARRDEQR
jgi:D-3-phosphoglycerate dehydrogenase / 2-oxoglutarate reductase